MATENNVPLYKIPLCTVFLLALVAEAWCGPELAEAPVAVTVSALASNLEGFALSTVMISDSMELRAWAGVPYALGDDGYLVSETGMGFAMELPYLRIGSVRPVGLQSFLYRPAASGFIFSGNSSVPLKLDNPADSSYLGVSAGENFGLVAMVPVSGPALADIRDSGQPAYGAWASARDGAWSAILASSTEAAEAGGPGWYNAPEPEAPRVWAAVGGMAHGRFLEAGAGAAVSTGFPGPDTAACRAEFQGSVGPVRLELVASLSSDGWSGLDGAGAPGFRLDAEARYARKGLVGAVGYRLVHDSWVDALTESHSVFNGKAELAGWFGLARLSAAVEPQQGSTPTLVLDSLVKPAIAPWMTLSSSWRVVDGKAERFDLLGGLAFGKELEFNLDSGIRFAPEATYLKGSCGLEVGWDGLSLAAGIRSPGWIMPEGVQCDKLEYTFKVVFRIP